MKITVVLAALATAATLLVAAPANGAEDQVVRAWTKSRCLETGNTRVQVRVETKGAPLIDYVWRIDGRSPHVGDVLVEGGEVSTLIAFTVPAGSRGRVTVDPGGLNKQVRARTC